MVTSTRKTTSFLRVLMCTLLARNRLPCYCTCPKVGAICVSTVDSVGYRDKSMLPRSMTFPFVLFSHHCSA